ncbi:MAG: Ig-like domain-containing protein [Sulfurimonas sp.]
MKINKVIVGIILGLGLVFGGCARNGVPSKALNENASSEVKVKQNVTEPIDTMSPVFANGTMIKKSVKENQNSAITLNASDETSSVSYFLVGGDSKKFKLNSQTGEVTFLRVPDYEATPIKNSYVFAAIAKDEALNESSQTVIINVLDVAEVILNKPPVAKAGKNQSVQKGAQVILDASLSSDDGVIRSYAWSEGSKKLSTNKQFQISTLGVGTHKITLKVTDDKGEVASDTVIVSVKGLLNKIPKASEQSLRVGENQKLNIILSGTDEDGDKLTYSIVTKPSHGSLRGKAPRLTYTPTRGEVAKDEFAFMVSDGKATSAVAIISIKVIAVKTKGIIKNGVTYNTVKSPYTGKLWLDRNLGASKVCSALDDTACYGNYYQWGRNQDGHQKSNSAKTRVRAKKIYKAGTKFIKNEEDWSAVDSNGAKRASNWSATDGSSICPTGYRVPTNRELAAETTAANSAVSNKTDAFKNFLKLPSAGYRYAYNGKKDNQATYGFVWTTSAIGKNEAKNLQFDAYDTVFKESYRAFGFSVRCVKD